MKVLPSRLPVSIIVVGIGSADFRWRAGMMGDRIVESRCRVIPENKSFFCAHSAMLQLDGDIAPLRHSDPSVGVSEGKGE